jgi:hypothetical protein
MNQIDVDLDQKLEDLKTRLVQLFMEKGTFLDPNVIAVSQDIDDLIVHIQRRQSEIFLEKK